MKAAKSVLHFIQIPESDFEFARHRVEPFLRLARSRTLLDILANVYTQGLIDADQAIQGESK